MMVAQISCNGQTDQEMNACFFISDSSNFSTALSFETSGLPPPIVWPYTHSGIPSWHFIGFAVRLVYCSRHNTVPDVPSAPSRYCRVQQCHPSILPRNHGTLAGLVLWPCNPNGVVPRQCFPDAKWRSWHSSIGVVKAVLFTIENVIIMFLLWRCFFLRHWFVFPFM